MGPIAFSHFSDLKAKTLEKGAIIVETKKNPELKISKEA